MTRLAFSLLLVLGAATPAASQSPGDTTRMLYTKHEYRIPMRDGVKLYTAVYVPKDTTARTHPIPSKSLSIMRSN